MFGCGRHPDLDTGTQSRSVETGDDAISQVQSGSDLGPLPVVEPDLDEA